MTTTPPDTPTPDQLLDRISEGGIGALTDAERKELSAIRDRLRQG